MSMPFYSSAVLQVGPKKADTHTVSRVSAFLGPPCTFLPELPDRGAPPSPSELEPAIRSWVRAVRHEKLTKS